MKKHQNKDKFDFDIKYKFLTLFAILFSTLFIYKLGKSVGGFVYYLLN